MSFLHAFTFWLLVFGFWKMEEQRWKTSENNWKIDENCWKNNEKARNPTPNKKKCKKNNANLILRPNKFSQSKLKLP